jgi:hypothetical protein
MSSVVSASRSRTSSAKRKELAPKMVASDVASHALTNTGEAQREAGRAKALAHYRKTMATKTKKA